MSEIVQAVINLGESNIDASLTIANALNELSRKITPYTEPYSDTDIDAVGCIVEGQIANAKGLFAIARAIQELAEAIRESK